MVEVHVSFLVLLLCSIALDLGLERFTSEFLEECPTDMFDQGLPQIILVLIRGQQRNLLEQSDHTTSFLDWELLKMHVRENSCQSVPAELWFSW